MQASLRRRDGSGRRHRVPPRNARPALGRGPGGGLVAWYAASRYGGSHCQPTLSSGSGTGSNPDRLTVARPEPPAAPAANPWRAARSDAIARRADLGRARRRPVWLVLSPRLAPHGATGRDRPGSRVLAGLPGRVGLGEQVAVRSRGRVIKSSRQPGRPLQTIGRRTYSGPSRTARGLRQRCSPISSIER